MPVYPEIKTYRAGFYNNSTARPRTYNALDVRKPYDTVFSDGVMPADDGTAGDTLKVTATSGMGISIATGHAKLGGAWFENTSAYNITLDAATGSVRYDCVIIKNDDRESAKEPEIYIKSLNRIPTISDLTRNDYVYEICIAYIRVPALATLITNADITDTRIDGVLCNVMSGVGAMVVRTYNNSVVSTVLNQTTVNIGIPQFNRVRDTLIVTVEGRIFTERTNYTIPNNSQVEFTIGFPVIGTKIDFQVLKNVNAAGAETVVQEVAQLTQYVNVINQKVEYDYLCNGSTDNILISNIVKTFLGGGSDNGSLKLNIIGNIGVRTYARGTGTIANPYVWFDFLVANATRRVIIDFGACSEMNIPVVSGKYNVVCNSKRDAIINANIIANNTSNGTVIRVFSVPDADIYCERCRFYITGYQDSVIAYSGTFRDCRGSVANTINNSYCFLPSTNGLVKVNGGEYYAFTGDSSKQSAVVGQSGANAVSILYGVNAPTIARSGYYQTNSLIQFAGGGMVNCTDLVSTLPMTVTAGISNIRGTIEKNKPNQM